MIIKQFHLVSVVGARPQFVKLAPIHHECVRRGVTHSIIHTGQHYDPGMSDVFFEELGIPQPTVNLAVGSGSHAIQTGRMIERLDAEFTRLTPDAVIVYGDTNTTLAAAVAASKRIEPLVHLEAGLRSFNRQMPEEINRILVDHASDLLLAPTEAAMKHLVSEGLGHRSVVVGDVMVDTLNFARGKVATHPPTMPPGWDPTGNYLFATIHRAENTDNSERLAYVMRKLAEYPIEVRLAVHPRLRGRLTRFGIEVAGAIRACEPLSYFQTVSAMVNAQGVVTDSGGLQKEAAILGNPCITVRHESEWVETIDAGWNVLDPDLKANPLDWFSKPRSALSESLYGDGQAASRILDEIGSVLNGVPQ